MTHAPRLALLGLLLVAAPAAAQFETGQVSPPGSASPLLLVKQLDDVALAYEDLSATVAGVTYNVYRRLPGQGFRCLQANLTAPATTAGPERPAGEAWWYSVVADDSWGENLHGNEVAIEQRCPCSGPAPVPGTPTLRLATLVTGLTRPVHLASAPGDRSRLYVVEQAGRIRLLRRGVLAAQPFLDIVALVRSAGNEQGLLSVAFHPDHATNGRFYVYYTANAPRGEITIAEYRRDAADPDRADPASGRIVFTCPHTLATNHNGGQLAFGPDGFLYIGTGDGGSGCDPQDNAEDLGACLGKLLRIDVDTGVPYAVPPTNPFLSTPGALPEIWAFGLRNPWRFSFDPATGDLYIADVGQGVYEEVDVQPAASRGGEDYGWNMFEGSCCAGTGTMAPCQSCGGPACDPAGKTFPVTEYPRSIGNSITGGHVYRGCRLPGYHGTYFYADFGSSRTRSFEYSGGAAVNPRDWTASFAAVSAPSSFGVDANGEIYIVGLGGTIWRIVP